MLVTDWSKYAPYFSEDEFRCRHTGRSGMDAEFMDILLVVRIAYGLPMRISSGLRDITHPNERKKTATGEHQLARCSDVSVYGAQAIKLLHVALDHGITRIGVQQKGDVAARFLHLGIGPGPMNPGVVLENPWIWSY